MLGQDGDFDLAFLDKKDRVGDVALAENLLVFPVSLDRLSHPDPAKKRLGIKHVLLQDLLRVGHRVVPSSLSGSTTLSVDGKRREQHR